jgi:hypothetical protein
MQQKNSISKTRPNKLTSSQTKFSEDTAMVATRRKKTKKNQRYQQIKIIPLPAQAIIASGGKRELQTRRLFSLGNSEQ